MAAHTSVDPESALDRLVDEGVVEAHADGSLTTTEAYERTRVVYHDTYGDADEATVVQALSDVFDVDREAVAAYVDEHDVGPADLVAYLSLQSFLDPVPDRELLATMAALVVEVGPGSPVPGQLDELDDDSYEAFLAEHPDAVLTVWKTGCHPCDAMKDDLDEILGRVPDGVAVAGLDGESVPSFRLEYGVDSAPAVLAFSDGTLVESLTGRRSPVALEQFFAVVYGDDDTVDPVAAVEAAADRDDGSVEFVDADVDVDE
ncbi:thioredoxin family protein [Salinigranum halophilum]|uniref:thioredoxin family protein n=1 Tax=Salinigranum halophilum TaxID=2565931 RepID=UPI0010A86F2A|nr:thioredoxin family protein [Salinigranum halophilum]